MTQSNEEFLQAARRCGALQIQSPDLPAALFQTASAPHAVWRGTPEDGRVLMELRPGMPPRRWAEIDRGGHLMTILEWGPRRHSESNSSGLVRAAIRSPGGRWVGLFAAHGDSPLWGPSDGIAVLPGAREEPSGGQHPAIAYLPSQNYETLHFIPPVDSPGALPPGTGTTLLNLFAQLMADRGVTGVRYKGPYPTPALFESLCTSFSPPQPQAEAIGTFVDDAEATAFAREFRENPLPWEPAPFEALLADLNIDLRLRSGIDAAWLDDIPFKRCHAQFPMPAGNRIWRESAEIGPRDVMGLVALGRPMRIFARMNPDGSRISPCEHWAESGLAIEAGEPFDAALRLAAVHWAVVRSTPALAEATASLGKNISIKWGAVARSLTQCTGRGIAVHAGLGAHFSQSLGKSTLDADGNPGRELALMLVSDLFGALSRDLAKAAQRRLAQVTPVPDPAALLARGQRCRLIAQQALNAALPRLLDRISEGRIIPG